MTAYRTANDNEYEAIKAAVKEALGGKASVRRVRSTKRAYNAVSIVPTTSATFKGHKGAWTNEELYTAFAIVQKFGLTRPGGMYENVEIVYRGGFKSMFIEA